jgi:hypothetical protein
MLESEVVFDNRATKPGPPVQAVSGGVSHGSTSGVGIGVRTASTQVSASPSAVRPGSTPGAARRLAARTA